MQINHFAIVNHFAMVNHLANDCVLNEKRNLGDGPDLGPTPCHSSLITSPPALEPPIKLFRYNFNRIYFSDWCRDILTSSASPADAGRIVEQTLNSTFTMAKGLKPRW